MGDCLKLDDLRLIFVTVGKKNEGKTNGISEEMIFAGGRLS
jgi:hypothetical protein